MTSNSGKGSSAGSEVDLLCPICCEEEQAANVYFVPCSHKACAGCVQKMRVANIYKADRGVRCPFCRQQIEGYSDTAPDSAGANGGRAAFQAGRIPFRLATADGIVYHAQLYGRGAIVSIGGLNDYVPPKAVLGVDGAGLKMMPSEPPKEGYVVPPLKGTEDLLSMACDRTGSRHLSWHLRPENSKRNRLVKQIIDALLPTAAQLATHPVANFVLQKVLEIGMESRGRGAPEDSFTSLIRSMTHHPNFCATAMDVRGNFAVQKLVLVVRGAEELCMVLDAFTGHLTDLSCHPYGVFVVERLAELQICSLLPPTPTKSPRVPPAAAVEGLSRMCAELSGTKKGLLAVASHPVTALVLVECIRWSLPVEAAHVAAMGIANAGGQLAGSRHGNRVLVGLLSLNVREVAECVVGRVKSKLLDLGFDAASQKMLRAALACPCLEDATRSPLVDGLADLAVRAETSSSFWDQIPMVELLAFGLSLLALEGREERCKRLRAKVSHQHMHTLTESIKMMISAYCLNPNPTPNPTRTPTTTPPPPSAPLPALQPSEDRPPPSSSAYTPPHVRGAATPALMPEMGDLALSRDHPGAPGAPGGGVKEGVYAPPHLRQNGHRSRKGVCVICEERTANTVLLSCSHMRTCAECSSSLTVCPICSAPVLSRVRIKGSEEDRPSSLPAPPTHAAASTSAPPPRDEPAPSPASFHPPPDPLSVEPSVPLPPFFMPHLHQPAPPPSQIPPPAPNRPRPAPYRPPLVYRPDLVGKMHVPPTG